MLSFRRWSALMLCALLSSIVPVGAHPVAGVAGVVTPQLNRPEAHPETLTFHPPVRPAAAPSLTLQVTVAPMTLVVGDTATVTVRVTNQGAGSAHGLALRLPRPDGAATDSAARDGWRWTAAELASQATATFSASLRLATLPRGAALVLNPQRVLRSWCNPSVRRLAPWCGRAPRPSLQRLWQVGAQRLPTPLAAWPLSFRRRLVPAI